MLTDSLSCWMSYHYPVIPKGPKHLYLLSDFIVISSFRSECQLCGWTVPTSGPRYLVCFSNVLRHQSEVLCVLAMDRGHVVRSEVLYVLLDQCQSVRSELLSVKTVHSVGSFHLPFLLSFALSFALSSALSSALSLSFPFLSPPRPRRKFFR
jgi:hypothetical protein